MGVAFLYFYDLLTPRYQTLNDVDLFVKGCAPHELYADALSFLVLGEGVRQELSYWTICQLITDQVAEGAVAVVGGAATGEIPSWFHDTYDDSDGDPNLVDFWVDSKTLRDRHRVAVVSQVRDAFGDYCDNRYATASAFTRGALRNPWSDGVCVPDVPTDVSVAAVGSGKSPVSWQGPIDDGGSPVEGSKVQRNSGAQQHSSSGLTVVTDLTDLQATITGLSNGTSHTIQVLAYNHNGDGGGQEITATPTVTDSSAPSLLTARLDPVGLSVHLAYDESLDETSAPPGTAFALRVNGAGQTPSVDIDGNVVTLGFAKEDGATPQDVLTVDYFEISDEGVLTFLNAPDYEQPEDADDDNVYELTVEASDESGNTRRLEVTVVVNLTD